VIINGARPKGREVGVEGGGRKEVKKKDSHKTQQYNSSRFHTLAGEKKEEEEMGLGWPLSIGLSMAGLQAGLYRSAYSHRSHRMASGCRLAASGCSIDCTTRHCRRE
jgi:hypothetical protein